MWIRFPGLLLNYFRVPVDEDISKCNDSGVLTDLRGYRRIQLGKLRKRLADDLSTAARSIEFSP